MRLVAFRKRLIDKNVVGNEEESRKQHGTRGKIYG